MDESEVTNNGLKEILYETIISFILNSSLATKSPQLKSHVISFVSNTLGVNFDQLSTNNKKIIDRKVFKFLQTFRAKLKATKNSRHIDSILQDDWSKNKITFNLEQDPQRKKTKQVPSTAGRKPKPFELKKIKVPTGTGTRNPQEMSTRSHQVSISTRIKDGQSRKP